MKKNKRNNDEEPIIDLDSESEKEEFDYEIKPLINSSAAFSSNPNHTPPPGPLSSRDAPDLINKIQKSGEQTNGIEIIKEDSIPKIENEIEKPVDKKTSWPNVERRSGKERRKNSDRRQECDIVFKNKRFGGERRSGIDRRKNWKPEE